MRSYCYPVAIALLSGSATCLTSLPREGEEQGLLSKVKGAFNNIFNKGPQNERKMNVNADIDFLPSLKGIDGMYLPERKLFGEHVEESLYLSFLKGNDVNKMKLGFITKTGPGERYKKGLAMDGSDSPWFNVTLNRYTGYLQLDEDSLDESQKENLKSS